MENLASPPLEFLGGGVTWDEGFLWRQLSEALVAGLDLGGAEFWETRSLTSATATPAIKKAKGPRNHSASLSPPSTADRTTIITITLPDSLAGALGGAGKAVSGVNMIDPGMVVSAFKAHSALFFDTARYCGLLLAGYFLWLLVRIVKMLRLRCRMRAARRETWYWIQAALRMPFIFYWELRACLDPTNRRDFARTGPGVKTYANDEGIGVVPVGSVWDPFTNGAGGGEEGGRGGGREKVVQSKGGGRDHGGVVVRGRKFGVSGGIGGKKPSAPVSRWVWKSGKKECEGDAIRDLNLTLMAVGCFVKHVLRILFWPLLCLYRWHKALVAWLKEPFDESSAAQLATMNAGTLPSNPDGDKNDCDPKAAAPTDGKDDGPEAAGCTTKDKGSTKKANNLGKQGKKGGKKKNKGKK